MNRWKLAASVSTASRGALLQAREQRLQIRLRLDERNAGGAHSDFETRSSPAEISSSAFASTL